MAGAKEATLADGHRIVDVDAAIVFGPLRRDNRGACGASAVFQGFAVSAQRKNTNLRRNVCHGYRTGAITSIAPYAHLALHHRPSINPASLGRPHAIPPIHTPTPFAP